MLLTRGLTVPAVKRIVYRDTAIVIVPVWSIVGAAGARVCRFFPVCAREPAMIFDILFFASAAAFGWGLSLATYRLFAMHYGWPMGDLHVNRPTLPVLLGLACLIVGFVFALQRGGELGGWAILFMGLVLSIVWTGILRVASQTSLFLAPAATVLVVVGWVLAALR